MRVCVSGYYGFRNTGDEAVLAGAIHGFESQGVARRDDFTVLSANPSWTQHVHGVRSVPRMQWVAVRAALRDTDVVLSGGGSLLQDVTSFRSLVYYLTILWMARQCGTPYVLFAQGIGPLRRRLSRWLVGRAARGASGITVRDAESSALLQQLGVPADRIVVTADPCFLLERPVDGLEHRRQFGLPLDKPVVVFAMRQWPGFAVEGLMRDAADRLAADGIEVAWLAMQEGSDRMLCRRVATAEQLVLDPGGVPELAVKMVACADVVVAMRLHALMLGVLAGAVPVAIAYDPKVAALMDRVGLAAFSLPLKAVGAEAVCAMVHRALEGRTRICRELDSMLPALRESAQANVRCAMRAVT